MEQDARIYVAGHRGLVGSALVRRLTTEGYHNLILRTHGELDLTRQRAVETFFTEEKPDYVFLAAAKVGGIWANSTYPAEFIYSNLAIQTAVLHASWRVGVKRLLFLGSACIYPSECPQPMREEHLLTGPLEPTNQPYAVAKITGIIQCEAYNRQYGTQFLAVMPTNLYGPNDNFDLESSHVLPALIRKFHLAKLASQGDWEGIRKDEERYGHIPEEIIDGLISIAAHRGQRAPDSLTGRPLKLKSEAGSNAMTLWGTGKPRREFLHVDDLAGACIHLMNLPEKRFRSLLSSESGGVFPEKGQPAAQNMPLINIGSGRDESIADLASIVAEIVGFDGDIVWDASRPDGMYRKLLDASRMGSLGWKQEISLRAGITSVYDWYCNPPSPPL